MLAESYVSLKIPAKAVRCADELIGLDGGAADGYFLKALALKEQGQFVQSIVYGS